MELPFIGLGTWLLKGKECTRTIKQALEIGYRHIDTAHIYENHQDIRDGIKGFPRENLFVTTKIHLTEVNFREVKKMLCRLVIKP